MASSIGIIIEMITHLISVTIQTAQVLISGFQKLLDSLIPVSASGTGGTILSLLILGLAGYFSLKFLFKSGKEVIVLLIIGIIIILLLITGNFLFV